MAPISLPVGPRTLARRPDAPVRCALSAPDGGSPPETQGTTLRPHPDTPRTIADRIALALSGLLAAFIAALVIGTVVNGDEPAKVAPLATKPQAIRPAAEREPVAVTAASTAPPPCASVKARGAQGVTCKSSSALLHLAGTKRTVGLADLEVGVTKSVVQGGEARVTVWAFNPSDRRRLFNGMGAQVYLTLGGRRVRTTQQLALDPGTRTQLSLRFALPEQLLAKGGRLKADLGIVPFAEAGAAKPGAIGVVPLTFKAPVPAAPAETPAAATTARAGAVG
jgi:hypothetical protein